jgi:Domain of unknown function (DUF6484)
MNRLQPATTTSAVAQRDDGHWLPEHDEVPATATFNGTCLGRLAAVADGVPLVEFVHNPSLLPAPARSTVPISADQVGEEVVLVFADGDPAQPIILGCLLPPALGGERPVLSEGNKERLCVTAEREIVLRCGEASITLTRAGKIIIRGTYVMNRSTGVNQIKGGSVQIN